MLKRFRRLAACLALATLSGCATGERLSAASDVHGLLVSIRDNDRAAFDAHIDRTALEAEIQDVLVRRTSSAGLGDGLSGLGLLASGPLSHVAARVLLRPRVFRAIADYYGYRPDQPLPGTLTLAAVLAPLTHGRVCAKDSRSGACLLTFAQEEGTWRLVAFDASKVMGTKAGARP